MYILYILYYILCYILYCIILYPWVYNMMNMIKYHMWDMIHDIPICSDVWPCRVYTDQIHGFYFFMARPCCEDTLHEKTLKEIQETEEKLRPLGRWKRAPLSRFSSGLNWISSTQETKVLNQTMNWRMYPLVMSK